MDLGVLERTPEAGDVGAIDDLVAGFVARAERFASRAVGVRAAGEAVVSASVGAWATALGERAGRLAAGMDDAAGGCRQVAQVLAGYGWALRGLERRVMTARHEVATARIRAVAAQEGYGQVVLAGGSGAVVPWSWVDAPDWPVVPQAAGALRAWKQALAEVAAGLQAFSGCCTEREELDRDTATALVRVEVMASYAPGTGVDAIVDVPLVQALAAAGAGATLTAAQRRVLGEWFSDATQAVVDDPQDAAALGLLAGFLDTWGTDAGAMAAVFATVGGGSTLRLVTALGGAVRLGDHAQNDTLARLGQQLRAALAAGSSRWSTAQAQEFADAMFGPVLYEDGTASVIGYLFADPGGAPMGAAFTVAVADRLDAWEREHGRLPQGVHQPGYWLAVAGAPGTDPKTVLDPAAAVLGMLGTHPQAARDWLTGTGVDWSQERPVFDRDRMAYWFGERDWSGIVSDGFAGVAGLWAGIQAADGALEARQVAAINDLAFRHLSRNEAILQTEHISELGSLRLGQVIAAQLPGLMEIGVVRGPADQNAAWEIVATPVSSSGVVAAAVTRHELVRVLAAVTSQAGGYEAVQDALPFL